MSCGHTFATVAPTRTAVLERNNLASAVAAIVHTTKVILDKDDDMICGSKSKVDVGLMGGSSKSTAFLIRPVPLSRPENLKKVDT